MCVCFVFFCVQVFYLENQCQSCHTKNQAAYHFMVIIRAAHSFIAVHLLGTMQILIECGSVWALHSIRNSQCNQSGRTESGVHKRGRRGEGAKVWQIWVLHGFFRNQMTWQNTQQKTINTYEHEQRRRINEKIFLWNCDICKAKLSNCLLRLLLFLCMSFFTRREISVQ